MVKITFIVHHKHHHRRHQLLQRVHQYRNKSETASFFIEFEMCLLMSIVCNIVNLHCGTDTTDGLIRHMIDSFENAIFELSLQPIFYLTIFSQAR